MNELFAEAARETAREEARGWHFVRVAVERGLDHGGERGSGSGLTYKSRHPLAVGRRVEVPLGRGDRKAAGIVVRAGGEELAEGFDLTRIKPVARDTGARLPARLVELARWMAGYYVCPLGMVLTSMMPAAVKSRTGLRKVVLVARAEEAEERVALKRVKFTPSVRATWEAIERLEGVLPLEPRALSARIGQKTLASVNRLIKLGLLREVESEDVRQRGGVPTQMGIEQPDRRHGKPQSRPALTNAQAAIVEGIAATLEEFQVHLLRGVTGSGKTEVYLRVIERVLAVGKSALVLVPEISLTPQTAGRFVSRFADTGVAVLHSGLSASQRHKEWARAASGAARVVVGARSAVFAPLDRLGVVVVDEEHASDYKQDQLPRYHGRDVAVMRAHMDGCPVVLGSATPSLESWINATGKKPKYRLWELTERVGGGRLPRVEVVNLNEERRAARGPGASAKGNEARFLPVIGPTLEHAIEETLRQGGQVILLLNKRGYASFIACADARCGWVLGCDECDARMVQHRVIAGSHVPRGMVRCHHCLAQSLIPSACPQCGKGLIALGMGTQRIEEELVARFGHLLGATAGTTPIAHSTATMGISPTLAPNVPREWTPAPGMLRIDGDTMHSARDYFEALSRFARGELRLLVGTQMISKGLDFPNVRLVGVVNADTALGLPDFRAAERTFQIISQVAGRAGRGSMPGRVIVQTVDPTQPAIEFASRHDYTGFAAYELGSRQRAGLPPTRRMARIVCRDKDLAKARERAQEVAGSLRAEIGTRARPDAGTRAGISMMGPMPCPIARIAGQHRIAIELLAPGRSVLQEALQAVRARGLLKSDAHTAVDIDPIALM